MITRVYIIRKLKELQASNEKDPELTHYECENLLLKYLAQEGYKDVAEAYKEASIGFYYA